MKRIVALFAVFACGTAATTAGAAGLNAIRISGPGPAVHGAVYDLTLSGFSAHKATAYLFVDYAGCAPTLNVELRRAPHAYDRYAVQGAFAEVSGWVSSSAGLDHACAYLVARGRAPLAGARSWFLVR